MILSFWHFYWGFGGKYGVNSTIPELNEEQLFKPGKFPTFFVGFGLFIMALTAIILNWNTLVDTKFFSFIKILTYIFMIIFILRAIGDFKYIGFFKKVKNTKFSLLDTKFYSPLCILITVLFFYFI